MKAVSKIKLEGSLKDAIIGAVDDIGGFDRFIKKGDRVLLKPNFNTADPYPASTDLEFLKTVMELVYEAGAKTVMIGDSCTFSLNTERVMKKKNIFSLVDFDKRTRIINFDKEKRIKKEIPNGKYLKYAHMPKILDEIDKLILLPCMKTHFIAQFTGSLKLSVGFLSKSDKMKMHVSHVQEKTAELNKIVNPDLVIMDGRTCFISGGPAHGEKRESGFILASESRVDIDIEGIKTIQSFEKNSLANIDPEKLTQIKLAKELEI